MTGLPDELIRLRSESAEATIAYGRQLAAHLPQRAWIGLTGDLGAGKTTLMKGLAEGLVVAPADDVTSPSYTLVHEYRAGDTALYHIDLYRLEGDAALATLGLEDLWSEAIEAPRSVVAVEWGNKFPALWRGVWLDVRLTILDERARLIQADWRSSAVAES